MRCEGAVGVDAQPSLSYLVVAACGHLRSGASFPFVTQAAEWQGWKLEVNYEEESLGGER